MITSGCEDEMTSSISPGRSAALFSPTASCLSSIPFGLSQDSRMAFRALPELADGFKSSNNILVGFIGHTHLFYRIVANSITRETVTV